MRRVVVLVVALAFASVFAGAAAASPRTHFVVSNNWQGITFVAGLDSCPVFGPTSAPWYTFEGVDLTDQIEVSATPSVDPLAQFDSVGAVHGTINAPDGTYTVAGGGLKEHRLGDFAPWYFSGTGHVTITGPGGTVVGQATFQDLTDFPPQEFDLLFTSITACHLRAS